MDGSFTFKQPGLIRRLSDKFKYRKCIKRRLLAPEPSREVLSCVATLREKGTLLLDKYINDQLLAQLQEDFQSSLEDLDFEMPCLSQSKIDPERHKDLIQRNMLAHAEELEELGVAFNTDEAHSFDQVVTEFEPSTLTVGMLEYSESYARVWFDEFLLAIVTEYMGLVPHMAEAYVRRNYPAKYRVMNHYWHRDLNNKRYLLKMFVFLTDCTLLNGPHEFLRGTHNDYSRLNGEHYYTDESVDAFFPPNSPDRFISEVKAGTIVIEDTRGLHRASVPREGFRDLGYAVFMPQRGEQPARYRIHQNVVKGLSSFQKAFLTGMN